MTVYEMIQELSKYPPDAEVQFEATMTIDGHAGTAVEEKSEPGTYWVEDFLFDDLLGIKSIEPIESYIDGTGERKCPNIKLTY